MMKSHLYVAALTGVAQLVLVAPAFAQDAGGAAPSEAGDEDIVVTATRQGSQSLQDVPLAIQAFTGEQLKRQGINDTSDLIQSVPGAAPAEQVGAVIKTVTLRGVGGTSGVGDSPIGYYIDDIPFAVPNSPIAPPLRFIDIDRVEVLRGPQGTLYGQGSAGGTIIYRTRDPDLARVGGQGEVTLGKTDDAGGLNYGASAAISLPLITDKLGLRVSGGYDKRAGYVDIYDGAPGAGPRRAKDANDVSNRDIRAVLLFKPTDDLTIRAQASHWEPRQDYSQSISSVEPPQKFFLGGIKGYEKGNFDLYGLTVEYDFGSVVARSSTSYLDAKFGYLSGQDFGALGTGSLFNGYDADNFAQEVQLRSDGASPFHWVVGGFYQNGKGRFDFDAQLTALTVAGFNQTKTKSHSVFGEISYDFLGGKIVPLVGVRYYKDDRSYVADSILTGSGSGRTKPDKVTWRANLSFYPTDDLTAFATVSTGFRSGITQTPFQVIALELAGVPGQIALDPDSLTNYEAGIKARLADGALQVGVNVYRIDFKDLQLGLVPLGIAAFANAGSAKTTGVDLELRWRTPIEGLNLGVVANFNDSEFGNVLPGVSGSVAGAQKGKRLFNTTKYNYRFDADFERPIGDGLRFFANGSAARLSSRVMADDAFLVDPYSNFNAALGIRADRWEISLFGENLGDERGPTFTRLGSTPSPVVVGPSPRTIGLRLRANFD